MFKKARALQLAWFIAGEFPLNPVKFFELITGVEPHSIQHAKPPQSPVPQSMIVGVRDGVQVRLHVQPGRADLYFEPLADPSQEYRNIPALEDPALLRNLMVKFGAQAASELSNVYRMGLNITYFAAFDNWEDAGRAFVKALPHGVNFPIARDSIYQFNVRSEQDGFELNRVLKWEVAQGQFVEFQMTPDGQGHSQIIHESDFVVYQVDLNNVASSHTLSTDDQIKLLSTLSNHSEKLYQLKDLGEL